MNKKRNSSEKSHCRGKKNWHRVELSKRNWLNQNWFKIFIKFTTSQKSQMVKITGEKN